MSSMLTLYARAITSFSGWPVTLKRCGDESKELGAFGALGLTEATSNCRGAFCSGDPTMMDEPKTSVIRCFIISLSAAPVRLTKAAYAYWIVAPMRPFLRPRVKQLDVCSAHERTVHSRTSRENNFLATSKLFLRTAVRIFPLRNHAS